MALFLELQVKLSKELQSDVKQTFPISRAVTRTTESPNMDEGAAIFHHFFHFWLLSIHIAITNSGQAVEYLSMVR